jgi:NAD(P)-dependent dehydrogenase (short-subunit alcohol dehydrogenase family)
MTSVLITGTSSGIGRATALRLARRPDLTVYASARTPDAIGDLGQAGCRLLPLDVTDEDSMAAAVGALRRAQRGRGQADGGELRVEAAGRPAGRGRRVIERAVTARRPRIRYVVTPAARMLVHMRRLLGARFFDAYLRMQFRPTS